MKSLPARTPISMENMTVNPISTWNQGLVTYSTPANGFLRNIWNSMPIMIRLATVRKPKNQSKYAHNLLWFCCLNSVNNLTAWLSNLRSIQYPSKHNEFAQNSASQLDLGQEHKTKRKHWKYDGNNVFEIGWKRIVLSAMTTSLKKRTITRLFLNLVKSRFCFYWPPLTHHLLFGIEWKSWSFSVCFRNIECFKFNNF